jgi:hypothetical protein
MNMSSRDITRTAGLTVARRALGVSATALVLAACGSDEATVLGPEAPSDQSGGGTGGEPGDDNAGDDSGDQDPLYLIATSFITGDQLETYLITSKTFDESTVVDPTNGPKLLGGIDITVGAGYAFAPDSNGPVLIRYAVDDDDQLAEDRELSFAGVGMTSILGSHVFVVSETKGYVFDPAGPRIVVWNPSTMTLTGEQIDLEDISRDGWSPNLSLGLVNQGGIRRGDELLVPLSWQDQDGNSRFASGVLVLDTTSDSVVAVDEDERCGETFTNLSAPNGDVYFFPPAWSATAHYFIDMHQPTCVLRVRSGESAFDDDYELNLSALGSGSAAAGAIPDGENGFFFLSVDRELWDDRPSDLAAFWRVWHYDFEREESREVSELPAWVGHAHYVNLGDDIVFVYWEETEDGNRTTFYRVDGADDPERLFSYEASWYSFARLR